jgi:cell division protein FtsB
MLPNMKFYIVSIVSIFAALGIGIYIGFSMDSQDFMNQQKESLMEMLEKQFDVIMNENKDLKTTVETLQKENEYKDKYIESSYDFIIDNRLKDFNVGIIETNSDYITSGIGKELELAGAKVTSLTTIENSIIKEENFQDIISELANALINGVSENEFENLKKEGIINILGNYNEPIDYLIICGGSFEEQTKRINQVDKLIINLGEKHNIPVLGVEKSNVEFSYIPGYKNLGISTVDNVDTTIGKVAMILTMEGMAGDYGIKSTAKSLIPNIKR